MSLTTLGHDPTFVALYRGLGPDRPRYAWLAIKSGLDTARPFGIDNPGARLAYQAEALWAPPGEDAVGYPTRAATPAALRLAAGVAAPGLVDLAAQHGVDLPMAIDLLLAFASTPEARFGAPDEMTAAEAGAALGVKPATIRDYVRRGLLPAPRRLDARRSLYQRAAVETLRAGRN